MSSPYLESLASARILVPTLTSISIVLLYQYLVQPFFVSPLRHIPGPKLAALSQLYLARHYLTENGVQLIQALHTKYGPIVRVGPNEIVIDDAEQLPVIYGVRSTYPKPPTAVLFENYGFPNAFSATDRDQHKQRRKQVSKVYTMSVQLNNAPLLAWIQNRLDLIKAIVNRTVGGQVDIYQIATRFALDNVSYMVYGESLNLLEGNNLEIADAIRDTTIASVPFVRFSWFFTSPLLAVWPLAHLLPDFMKKAVAARDILLSINENQINSVNGHDKKPDPDRTAVGCMQAQGDFGKTVTDGHVKSESLDHVAAGKSE
jgi:hypothetical protein